MIFESYENLVNHDSKKEPVKLIKNISGVVFS